MKFTHALILASSLAFFACGDDESSTGPSNNDTADCSVTDGVKVVSPKGGEEFQIGDKITVVYGSDVQGSGYRFVFKASEDDMGVDLLEESAGPEKPDGKTCYEQEITLSEDLVEATSSAIIRVIPYENTKKGANSGTFKVKE